MTRKACDQSLPDIDALSLMCLRADHERQATTTLFPFTSIPASFLREFTDVLSSSEFEFEAPQYMAERRSVVGPVLHFASGGHPVWRYNMNGMHGTTPRAEKALRALEEVMDTNHVELRLVPGQAVFINNRSCLHARGAGFQARHDGTDRWLIRSFWSSEPRAEVIDE